MARRGPGAPTPYGQDTRWWEVPDGRVHERLIPYVEQVERSQSATFDRFAKLAFLYDPYSPTQGQTEQPKDSQYRMTENVIATNCDSIAGTISATEVRARFVTDGGDWSTQRRARQLDYYAEELVKLLDIDAKCRLAFHAGSLKGTGVVKIWVDAFGQIRAEHIPVDSIVVDEAACRGDMPRQMQQRSMVSRDQLLAEYPEHRKEIETAQKGSNRGWKKWAGYRPIGIEELVVVESWRLPMGPKGHKNYVPGKHSIVIDGCDLLNEPYHKPHYPFAIFKWTPRPDGWYGIGGGERIIGHQRKLDRRNFQIDRQHDQFAFPTTWVRLADANIAVRTCRAGNIGVYKSDVPKTEIPPAISPETFRDRDETKASAYEEFGQSRMQATAMKPAGLDSGIALREYRDQTTARFANQEKGFEQLKLDCVFLAIDCAKDLKESAPEVVRRSRFGARKIKWADVNMGEVRCQLVVASQLGRTPAGRTQFVMEMAQAGIISQDSARRLLMPNGTLDTEAELSRYVAALENIERTIDEIEDGAQLVPEPYQNLEMGVWRMQMAYLKDRDDGAPEEVLESLRQWIVLAAHEIELAKAPDPAMPQPGMVDPMAAPMAPADPNAMAPMPGGPTPAAALAPQAMQLRAV